MGVFRLTGNDSYVLQKDSFRILSIVRFSQKEIQGCTEQHLLPPFPVAKGDLLGVFIRSICKNTNNLGIECPGQPNLNTTTKRTVFYQPFSGMYSTIQAGALTMTENYVAVSINVRASISMSIGKCRSMCVN